MKPISWWGGVIFLGDFPYLGRRGVISGSLGRVLMFPWGHFLPFGDDHFLGGPYIPLVSQTASWGLVFPGVSPCSRGPLLEFPISE